MVSQKTPRTPKVLKERIKILCKCGWWSVDARYDISWHREQSGCELGQQKFVAEELDI